MGSKKKDSEPLENFTAEEHANLEESIKALDQDDELWEREQINKKEISINSSLKRLRRSPLEIINRILFFFFLGSFLYSFIAIYMLNLWWFYFYIISAFSCIFYTPNRKALKELIAAWPNIEDIIKSRSLFRK